MGWYHYQMAEEGHVGDAPECPDGTCSLPKKSCESSSSEPKPKESEVAAPPTATKAEEQEELYDAKGSIFHLCQKKIWLQAIQKGQPYYPPTFWLDGKFTRFSCEQSALTDAANHYYKNIPGNWLCLEIDARQFQRLGIPIVAQRAPESTPDEPVQCLKVYSGIPVEVPGFVHRVYAMRRDEQGAFYGMKPDLSTPAGKERPAPAKVTSATTTTSSSGSKAKSKAADKQETAPKSKKGGFFFRRKSTH